MIRKWQDDGWRRRFAILPIFLSDGPEKQMIWLEWVWVKDMALYRQVSVADPRATLKGTDDHG
jgi:hypothetical protein